jgi:cytochrome c553
MIDHPWRRGAVRGLSLAGFGCAAFAAMAPAAIAVEVTGVPPDVAGIVHVCSSCHGPRGQSLSSTFPRLAGQQKDYIDTQLKAFRDHTRADPHAKTYMWGMAARLTDEQIGAVADYYAAQPPVPGEPDASPQTAPGAKIFMQGIPAKDVLPCMSCHGEKAEGNGPIPRLAGQHPPYLARQLEAFASLARANEIMHENSKNLTPDEIAAVAAYLGTQ